jgi:hypothetical protein
MFCIVGLYSWYLFATAVNEHADRVATLLIEDTLNSSKTKDIKNLRAIKKLITENENNKAIALVDKLIEDNIYMLEQCVTEKCNEVTSKYYEN